MSFFGDAAGFVGDVVTGGAISNNDAIAQTNAANIAFAKQQQDFQERMSNTAYQRAMADMQSAGLNPMLAYTQGGASVPTGTTPSLTAPRPGDIGAGAATTASNLARGVYDLKKTGADIDLAQSNKNVADAQAAKTVAQTAESMQNTAYTKQQEQESRVRAAKLTAEARSSKAKADFDEANRPNKLAEAGYAQDYQRLDAINKHVTPMIGDILGNVRNLFSSSAKKVSQPPPVPPSGKPTLKWDADYEPGINKNEPGTDYGRYKRVR